MKKRMKNLLFFHCEKLYNLLKMEGYRLWILPKKSV